MILGMVLMGLLATGIQAATTVAPATADLSGASIVAAIRMVRVKLPDGSVVPARTGMKLEEGTQILTLARSLCVVKFVDGRILSLKPDTTIVIARVPSAARRGVLLRLMQGTVRAFVDPDRGRDAEFAIFATTVLTAVKGTDYEVSRDREQGITVSVANGTVAVLVLPEESVDAAERALPEMDNGKGVIALHEGFQVLFRPGQPVPIPHPLPKGWFDSWDFGTTNGPTLPGARSPGGAPGIP